VTPIGERCCAALFAGLAIDGAPEVVRVAIDLHKHLVELPLSVMAAAQATHPPCKHRPKACPPEAHCLVTNIDTAFEQEALGTPQRQPKPHIYQHDQADNLWRRVEKLKKKTWRRERLIYGSSERDISPLPRLPLWSGSAHRVYRIVEAQFAAGAYRSF